MLVDVHDANTRLQCRVPAGMPSGFGRQRNALGVANSCHQYQEATVEAEEIEEYEEEEEEVAE